MNEVLINNQNVSIKEYDGKRVVTFKDIDTVHNRPEGTARRNFNINKKHFIEGVDYFKICANEIRTHKIMELSPKVHKDLTLMTESGYLMLAKSLTDDLSWDVQRQLVNSYFKTKLEPKLTGNELIAAAVIEAKALLEQKDKQICVLETTVAVQEQQISELKPKASYYDVVLNCPGLLAVSVIAKDYGKSAKWLNAYLHKKGIQYKQGKTWLLYQKYAECGYTCTKTSTVPASDGTQHTKVHTYWTQKGRLFIYDTLKSDGILPLIEYKQSA